jgi:hypothetical protein
MSGESLDYAKHSLLSSFKTLKSGELKKQTNASSLDFKKAFDKGHHNKLFYELQSCGSNLKVLNWIHDFLSDRKQRVVID